MLDLHAHILPGIDDGPRTTEDALLLLRALQDEGVQHVVATPHIYPGVYDNTPERIAQVFTAFQRQAEAAGLTLGMSWGAEVRLCPEVLDWLDAGTLVALGDGDQGRRTVLLEMPDGQVPVGADRLVARLVARGWQPLIAHPERNRQVMEHPTALEPLLAAGAVFQLTAASLLGDFGQRAQAAAQRLLALDGAVMAVASDTHNLKGRRPQMKAARAWLVEQFGEARAHDLTERQPARLVGVGQVVFEGRDGTVLRDLTGAVSPGVVQSAGIDLLDFPAAGTARGAPNAPRAPVRMDDWDLSFALQPRQTTGATPSLRVTPPVATPAAPAVVAPPVMPPQAARDVRPPPLTVAAPSIAPVRPPRTEPVFDPTSPAPPRAGELDIAADLARYALDAQPPQWANTEPAVLDIPAGAVSASASTPRVPSPSTPPSLAPKPVSLERIPVLQAASVTPVVPTVLAPARSAVPVRAATQAPYADVERRRPPTPEAAPAVPVAKLPTAAPAPVKVVVPPVVSGPLVSPVAAPPAAVSPKGQETVHLSRTQTVVRPEAPRPSGGTTVGGVQGFKLGDFDVRLDPAKPR